MRCRRRGRAFFALLALATVGGCAPIEPRPAATDATETVSEAAKPAPSTQPSKPEQVLAQNERYVIYLPSAGDTLRTIAQRFLRGEDREWVIADFNRINRVQAGQPLIVPLKPANPTGVFADGYQTVPILCYHRFGQRSDKMTVTPEAFSAQLSYLARNDYRVIRLSELIDFLEGRGPLPKRAVVITMDDGYASFFHMAFPLLKKHGFPATLFIYTDFIGAKDALSWQQMQQLTASGLVDIQVHSKTHSNLTYKLPGESDERYRERLDSEIRLPRSILQQRLPVRPAHFAYPYGDTNDTIVQRLKHADYTAAVTVHPGPNSSFSPPLALRRTMIFGDHDLEAFKSKLQVFREMDLQ